MNRFPTSNDKREWRTWAQALRGESGMTDAHLATLPRLTQLNEWINAHHVLLYCATPQEINVHSLLSDIIGKQWHFPRCAARRTLSVRRVYSGLRGDWTISRFGIEEPPPDSPEVAPEALDLVIVPALAFDECGYRLGYGGGYYDRFLPRLRPDCVTVGLMLDALVVTALPAEPHDVPVQIVVTETRTIRRAGTTAPTRPPYSG